MKEFTLKPREAETLRLTIGEESYQIPLAGFLTPEEAVPLDTQEGTIAFFKKYIPEEVSKNLRIDDYNAITNAWIDASKKPGE